MQEFVLAAFSFVSSLLIVIALVLFGNSNQAKRLVFSVEVLFVEVQVRQGAAGWDERILTCSRFEKRQIAREEDTQGLRGKLRESRRGDIGSTIYKLFVIDNM
ncbi:uncharacterized protein LOC108629329 [Ceratina calcarata]|uniref:Uncharacterized protein LOC108629329 n=1 Tax=Ceratina calcarata TaxID=156304 RepID=A0AAJ7J9L5_9HYME|nr:uncharacterized protein LOC108629329 [Ceratina calcarata]